jgi:isocitrate/isopropylmalate dehydrogenase
MALRKICECSEEEHSMKILILPGDGIGPEITEATLAVLDRANAKFRLGLEWRREEMGLVALKKRGSTLPADVMEAALLLRDPQRFDCVVTTNMFGDILSDEASELSGSLGLAGSVMAGDDRCCAQAQHGSAPDIAGQDKANPTSLMLSAAMLLEWLGTRHSRSEFAQAAQAIESAIDGALKNPATRTADLGGKFGTRAFTAEIAGRI